jgi:hypothetical protein
MGRSPICDRAMTSAERQRRYLARIREQARWEAMVAAPKPKPPPIPAPTERAVRFAHIKMDPDRTALWVCRELGAEATRAWYDAIGRALAAIPSGALEDRAL